MLARVDEASAETIECLGLGGVMASVLAQLQPLAEERQLELRCECGPELMVRLSPERAQVLVSNLVLNAMQHSRSRETIHVRVWRCEESVFLEVKDCGSGIGEEALPHIFERFYREDQSRSRNTGGAGLGLAICKSIADGAGATIYVSSRMGEGTEVTVVFSAA